MRFLVRSIEWKGNVFLLNNHKPKWVLKVSLSKHFTALIIHNHWFINLFWEAGSELYECNFFKTYCQRDTVHFFPTDFPLIFWVTRQSGEVCYCSLQFESIHFLITVSNWLFRSIPVTHRKAVSMSLTGKTHLIQVLHPLFYIISLSFLINEFLNHISTLNNQIFNTLRGKRHQ